MTNDLWDESHRFKLSIYLNQILKHLSIQLMGIQRVITMDWHNIV